MRIIFNILKPWNGTHLTKVGIGSILCSLICSLVGYLAAQMIKTLDAMQETQVWSLDQEDSPEKWMATHSSILAWKIPWTEEAGRLQSMGSQRVRHNWATSTIYSLTVGNSNGKESAHNLGDLGLIPGSGRSPGGGHGNPLQDFCLENSMDRGAWWAIAHGVAKSQTRLGLLFPGTLLLSCLK